MELHPFIAFELRHTRNRSLIKEKKKGGLTTRNLQHLLSSSKLKDKYSNGGIYLGKAPALIINQDVVHRFLDRMARALHHHHHDTGYIECEIQKSNMIDEELQNLFACFPMAFHDEFGDDIFTYEELTVDATALTIWRMTFFGKIKCWASLIPRKATT